MRYLTFEATLKKILLTLKDIMGNCKNHSQVEGLYFCSKYKHYLCAQCVKCSDSKMYCKFRPSCLIQFLEKEKKSQKT